MYCCKICGNHIALNSNFCNLCGTRAFVSRVNENPPKDRPIFILEEPIKYKNREYFLYNGVLNIAEESREIRYSKFVKACVIFKDKLYWIVKDYTSPTSKVAYSFSFRDTQKDYICETELDGTNEMKININVENIIANRKKIIYLHSANIRELREEKGWLCCTVYGEYVYYQEPYSEANKYPQYGTEPFHVKIHKTSNLL